MLRESLCFRSRFALLFSALFSFFFSSRRRHTRYIGDWSSDVCSSDLFFAKKQIFLIFLIGRICQGHHFFRPVQHSFHPFHTATVTEINVSMPSTTILKIDRKSVV